MNPWRGVSTLPGEVWIQCTATFINRAGMMVLPFLALYLHGTLGYSVEQAGIALTVYGTGAFITAPFAGRMSDYLGARRVMTLSLLLSGVTLFGLLFLRSYALILPVTFLWAVISEAFRPASLVNIADLVPPAQRKIAFSVNRLAINLGMSIGPALGGFLIIFSYPLLFVVDGATAILAGLVLVFAPWKSEHQQYRQDVKGNAETTGTDIPPKPVPTIRTLIYFLIGLIPVVVVFFQHEGAMPLFLVDSLHLPASTYGLLFTINTGLIILLEVPLNVAMSKWPNRRALALGSFLAGLGFGAMGVIDSTIGVAITVVVWTFGEMILFPSAANYMADIAPAERRGAYMGFFQATFSFSFAISGWVGASILDHFGGVTLWAATFVWGCISAVMLWRVKP